MKLFYLQVLRHDYYVDLSQGNRVREDPIIASRGLILDRNGKVLVDNEPGVLARVIGLFSGRGYNIESLVVAEVDAARHLSRITLVTSGTPMVIEQIKAQLDRLVPVHTVRDLTIEGEIGRAHV